MGMYALAILLLAAFASACDPGQGLLSNIIWQGSVGDQNDCDAQCSSQSSCKYYDYTTSRATAGGNDECRLYTTEFGSRTDPGDDFRVLCDAGQASQFPVTYHCSSGQGAVGKFSRSYQQASELHCAFDCANDNQCKFFDYTTHSTGDNCRFFDGMFGGRPDPGPDHRVYCGVTKKMDNVTIV